MIGIKKIRPSKKLLKNTDEDYHNLLNQDFVFIEIIRLLDKIGFEADVWIEDYGQFMNKK